MSLLVIGTLAYDTVETAHDRRDEALGGSAMYFSVAASVFTSPRLVGVVAQERSTRSRRRVLRRQEKRRVGGVEQSG